MMLLCAPGYTQFCVCTVVIEHAQVFSLVVV